MKKSTVMFLVCAFLASLLMGCTAAPAQPADAPSKPEATEASNNKPYYETLKVGTLPFAMGLPVQYALEQGYFEDESLNVEVIVFPTGAPVNEAIAASELDVAVSGLATVFSLAIGACDFVGDVSTSGGMGILVREDSPLLAEQGNVDGLPNVYGSAEAVKGLEFLGPLGTAAQYNVKKYVDLLTWWVYPWVSAWRGLRPLICSLSSCLTPCVPS